MAGNTTNNNSDKNTGIPPETSSSSSTNNASSGSGSSASSSSETNAGETPPASNTSEEQNDKPSNLKERQEFLKDPENRRKIKQATERSWYGLPEDQKIKFSALNTNGSNFYYKDENGEVTKGDINDPGIFDDYKNSVHTLLNPNSLKRLNNGALTAEQQNIYQNFQERFSKASNGKSVQNELKDFKNQMLDTGLVIPDVPNAKKVGQTWVDGQSDAYSIYDEKGNLNLSDDKKQQGLKNSLKEELSREPNKLNQIEQALKTLENRLAQAEQEPNNENKKTKISNALKEFGSSMSTIFNGWTLAALFLTLLISPLLALAAFGGGMLLVTGSMGVKALLNQEDNQHANEDKLIRKLKGEIDNVSKEIADLKNQQQKEQEAQQKEQQQKEQQQKEQEAQQKEQQQKEQQQEQTTSPTVEKDQETGENTSQQPLAIEDTPVNAAPIVEEPEEDQDQDQETGETTTNPNELLKNAALGQENQRTPSVIITEVPAEHQNPAIHRTDHSHTTKNSSDKRKR